jgi:hypothetical protein
VDTQSFNDRGTRGRGLLLVAVVGLSIAAVALVLWMWTTTSQLSAVLDLSGRPIDLFDQGRGQVTVLIFIRSDFPISNRYAPEVQRVADRFATQGVRFWLVYVDPDENPQAVERHLAEYGYSLPAARDTEHQLVALTGARVTPEAAVYNSVGSMVYCGRIDNRYEGFNRRRSAPTKRDLEDALEAVLAGRDPEVKRRRAVGCYIADLK